MHRGRDEEGTCGSPWEWGIEQILEMGMGGDRNERIRWVGREIRLREGM